MISGEENTSNFVYTITDNIILNIVKLSHGYSILYCMDKMNQKIPIPEGINIFEYNKNIRYKIALNKINNEVFHLFCDHNYLIEYNNNMILDIQSKSYWNIVEK
jgi:hypothetical protein